MSRGLDYKIITGRRVHNFSFGKHRRKLVVKKSRQCETHFSFNKENHYLSGEKEESGRTRQRTEKKRRPESDRTDMFAVFFSKLKIWKAENCRYPNNFLYFLFPTPTVFPLIFLPVLQVRLTVYLIFSNCVSSNTCWVEGGRVVKFYKANWDHFRIHF